MRRVDIKDWKDFKISDIFETINNKTQVPTGGSVKKTNLKEGKTPRISVTNFNNGITGIFKDLNEPNYRTYYNFISVSFLGTVFYQPQTASLDMKVHCLKPLNHELNNYTGLFLVRTVENLIQNTGYSDQISSTVLPNLTIKLPARKNSQGEFEPDWKYMEDYMRSIEKQAIDKINSLSIRRHQNIE